MIKREIPRKRLLIRTLDRDSEQSTADLLLIGSHVFITIHSMLDSTMLGARRVYIEDVQIAGALAEVHK